MLTTSTAAGSSSSVAFSTAIPGEPLKMKPNTRCWRSRIQDNPDHIQVHSWVTIQLHCSVGTVDCMSVSPLRRGGQKACDIGVLVVRGGKRKRRADQVDRS